MFFVVVLLDYFASECSDLGLMSRVFSDYIVYDIQQTT